MSLLDDKVRGELREAFSRLVSPVRLSVFSQSLAEPASEEVRRLVEELAAFDRRLSAEPRNFVLDKDRAAELGIERIPAVAVLAEDEAVEFEGAVPEATLLQHVLDASRRGGGLVVP